MKRLLCVFIYLATIILPTSILFITNLKLYGIITAIILLGLGIWATIETLEKA